MQKNGVGTECLFDLKMFTSLHTYEMFTCLRTARDTPTGSQRIAEQQEANSSSSRAKGDVRD